MVAEALVTGDNVIIFPARASVVSLDLDSSQKLRSGVVPSHVKHLKLCQANDIEPGALGANVTHVYIRDLTRDMFIPPTVQHLAIYCYSGLVPLPSHIPNIYVHANDNKRVSTPCEHYIYHWGIGSEITQYKIDRSCCKPVGAQFSINMCDQDFTVLKMVPERSGEEVIDSPSMSPLEKLTHTDWITDIEPESTFITLDFRDIDVELGRTC